MATFNIEATMQKYETKTVLAISPCIINQITTDKLAREEMANSRAWSAPANVTYHVYWFNKKFSNIQ